MPRARVATAVSEKPGALMSTRSAWRTLRKIVVTIGGVPPLPKRKLDERLARNGRATLRERANPLFFEADRRHARHRRRRELSHKRAGVPLSGRTRDRP